MFYLGNKIGYPACHLCSKFYVQCEIKADIKYSYERVCKNHLILSTYQSKSLEKNNKNIELELLNSTSLSFIIWDICHCSEKSIRILSIKMKNTTAQP